MVPLGWSGLSARCAGTGEPVTEEGRLLWHSAVTAGFLVVLEEVEVHLHQLVTGGQADNGPLVEQVFRSASGLYRQSAQAGMGDFCDLAYEVAQAFGTIRAVNGEAVRRLALLALVAVGQLRRILSPGSEEEMGRHARQVMAGLLTVW
ncbi:MAG: hypothetical protein H7838_10475 [Magnetococcus sp. DMHC-8]